MSQTYTSACTSINSHKVPAVYSMPKAVDIMAGKSVIDIGGGRYDTAVEAGMAYGATIRIYDKYNRSEAHNTEVLSGKYQVSVISNVLNVIDSTDARADVIRLAAQKAPIILITVYEGNGSGKGKQTGADSWQENRKTADYVPEVSAALGASWDVSRRGKLIIAKLGQIA